MSESDMLSIMGTLFGAFASGWATGYVILVFKQLAEKI